MKISILIVDDHAAIIEGYKSILSFRTSKAELNITTAQSCEKAFQLITKKQAVFDVVLLDMILPPHESEKIYSGEDLAILVNKQLPEAKVILLTSHTESFVLYSILKKADPHGLLIKSDFTAEEFLEAFETVLAGEKYYSTSVKQSIREMQDKHNYLDTYNRQIIVLLAQGVKTKSLPSRIGLSLSAVDKRKAHIKEFFGIERGTDEDIIREAKRYGFV